MSVFILLIVEYQSLCFGALLLVGWLVGLFVLMLFNFLIRTPETTTSSKKEDQNNSFTETTATDELSLDDEEFLHMVTVLDLDTARQELEEFIPHVGQLSDHSIRKMAGRDLLRFKQFKRQGETSKECCSEEVCSCADILTEGK